MPTIIQNLERVHAAVVVDKFKKVGTNQKLFGDLLSEAAVLAIRGGITSPDWKKYMSLFADSQEQLSLLTEEKPTDESYFSQARAYIVSNAVCGAGTDSNVGMGVNRDFGKGLSEVVDPTIQKPFEIPPITDEV